MALFFFVGYVWAIKGYLVANDSGEERKWQSLFEWPHGYIAIWAKREVGALRRVSEDNC